MKLHLVLLSLTIVSLYLSSNASYAQESSTSDLDVSHQETLRGSITPERAWWDLKHYQLDLEVDIGNKHFTGSNTISYQVLSDAKELQLELQPPMKIDEITYQGKPLTIRKDGYSYFVTLTAPQVIGEEYQLSVKFSGQPHEAKNAPWDGGITWAEDGGGMPFIASSNQGIGASIWWPNKDHGYDEPDNGISINVTVPRPFVNVSNGTLKHVEDIDEGSSRTFSWQVKNPINNYGVNINIADYVHFSEQYQGEGGTLDMDYYVLRENEEKAREQFKDAKRTIEAMEHWFGQYPFYQDSFKLVEAPYLGMEHQSSVTYGNGYQNGYKGRDLSGTGWGLKWDFIIIHETAHEWFANSVTAKDVADLWIHEGFTTYAEGLFVEYFYGKSAGDEYIRGIRKSINNDKPMIGTYNANRIGSFDIYPKGANLLHTIRQIVNDDDVWRQLLRNISKTFFHQTISTQQLEDFMAKQTGLALSSVFDQYLRDKRVPMFEYHIIGDTVSYRWSNVNKQFAMPMDIYIDGDKLRLAPTTTWQTHTAAQAIKQVKLDENYYVAALPLFNSTGSVD